MACTHLQEHYEAFALGICDDPEASEIRAHVERGCETCTPGVEEVRFAATQLAYLAPEVEPPARVRRKLLGSVAESKPRARFSLNWAAALGWGVAAVLLIGVFFFQRQARELYERLAELDRQHLELASENERLRQVLAIVSSPETVPVSLGAPTSPRLHAYWNDDLGLVLAGSNMRLPSADRTYQLWVVPKEGNPISVSIFRPSQDGDVLLIAAPSAEIGDSAALAISEEPAGGSPQPTTQPEWVGPVG